MAQKGSGCKENLMSFSDDEDSVQTQLRKSKSDAGVSWIDVLSGLEEPEEQSGKNIVKTANFVPGHSLAISRQENRNKTVGNSGHVSQHGKQHDGHGHGPTSYVPYFGNRNSVLNQSGSSQNMDAPSLSGFRREVKNYKMSANSYLPGSNHTKGGTCVRLQHGARDGEIFDRSSPIDFSTGTESKKTNPRQKLQTKDKWIDFSSDDEASFSDTVEMRPRLRSSLSETDLYSSSPDSSPYQSPLWSPTCSSRARPYSDFFYLKSSSDRAPTASTVIRNNSSESGSSYYSAVDNADADLHKSSLYVDLGQRTSDRDFPSSTHSHNSLDRTDSMSSCGSLHPYDSIVLRRKGKSSKPSPRGSKQDATGPVAIVGGIDVSDGSKRHTNLAVSSAYENAETKTGETGVNTSSMTKHLLQQPHNTSSSTLEQEIVETKQGFHGDTRPLQVKMPELEKVNNVPRTYKQQTLPPCRPPPPKSLVHRYSTSSNSLHQVQPGNTLKSSDLRDDDQKRIMFFGDGLFDVVKERNEEAIAFGKMVSELRSQFPWHDLTNPGYVVSPALPYEQQIFDLSSECQIVVWTESRRDSVQFRANIHSLVQEVIQLAVAYILEGSTWYAEDFTSAFVMKVCGRSEFLEPQRMLIEYEYVKDCLKFSEDIQLVLVESDRVPRNLSRATADDQVDAVPHNYKDFFECPNTTAITRHGLSLLMEALNVEVARLLEEMTRMRNPRYEPSRVIQAVKALCASLATIETKSINEAAHSLRGLQQQPESGQVTTGSPVQSAVIPDVDKVKQALTELTGSAILLIEMYCDAFDTDFTASRVERPGLSGSIEVTAMTDRLRVHVASAHRLPLYWKQDYDCYEVAAGVYYGGKLLCPIELTPLTRVTTEFFEHIKWDKWLEFQIQVLQLPCESRLCVTLFGLTSKSKGSGPHINRTALGWVAVQLFNFNGMLASGTRLLGLWPGARANPVGACTSNLLHPASVLVLVGFERYLADIVFPEFQEINSLEMNEDETPAKQDAYKHILQKDLFSELKPKEEELLWEHRHYCQRVPRALPLILASVPSWDYQSLPEVYTLLATWSPMSPIDAMELLKVNFPDKHVRSLAVKWMEKLSDDELCDYLPQLVQALKYEIFHDSALVRFLLRRALSNTRLLHYLFWYLKDNISDPQFGQRFQITLGGLLSMCGEAQREEFTQQDELIADLIKVAQKVKAVKDSSRLSLVRQELEVVSLDMFDTVRLPINPGLEVVGLESQSCGYFTSNSAPLRLVFKNADHFGDPVQAIFKIGDDMRQDSLTMQLVGIMNKIWLREGLDLKMITYHCMATGPGMGMVEMVRESETLREIHTEFGLTGSFKDKPIHLWIQKHNPGEQEYRQAVQNFTASCAGYCVATYVLGICDRHNDNIMLKKSGHLFHIDFSKILGNAQMFGNFKRDRAPFILTPDMAFVINGGYQPSSQFQDFIDLCCTAFNVIRRHSTLFLNLLSLMLNSGITYLNDVSDLRYIRDSLLPGATEGEGTTMFTRLLKTSLSSWFTQVNFFIHNVAQIRDVSQLKLSGVAESTGSLLSFSPKTYSIDSEGFIISARVVDYHKRYTPEKYYVYVINTLREGITIPQFVFRRYSQFHELHTKLCLTFPETNLPRLPAKIYLGRSQIRVVAERRRSELDAYIRHLLQMPPAVSESDLLYTFLHPVLQDDNEAEAFSVRLLPEEKRQRERKVGGQVKLSIGYENETLRVMVMHAKGLSPRAASSLADPYVKLYLLPDPIKATKQKTQIARRTLNPTYNETLEYCRMSEPAVKQRQLQVTVWDHDSLGENEFLGGVLIDLDKLDLNKATARWYTLQDLRKP